MKPQWKNRTSYSQGDKERTPLTWALECKTVIITVTRRHGLEGWFLLCAGIGIDSPRSLRSPSVDAAQSEAIATVLRILREMVSDVELTLL